ICIKRANQLFAGENTTGLAAQLAEQAKLDRGQAQRMAMHARLEALLVQYHRRLERRIRRAAAAQHGANPRDDLARAERFADVIVGTEFEAEQAVDLLDPRGEHEDGHRGKGADLPTQGEAVDAGQVDVEKDRIGSLLVDPVQRQIAVVEDAGAETGSEQIVAHQGRQLRLVLDDQHMGSRVHAPAPMAGRRTSMRRPPSVDAEAAMWPPWASTMARQMARPRPAPPAARLREASTRYRRSNNSSSESAG